jgi:hypothetical protein
MSVRANVATLLGLVVALAASWLVWHSAHLTPSALHFAASVAPLILWGLFPVFLSWFGRRRGAQGDSVRAVAVRDLKIAILYFFKL